MSAVYRGYDTVMKREVAIKRLLPIEETNLNEPSGDLIEKEAAVLARFQHPNIVTIFAIEEDKDGPYVVMELIDGEDLHSVMTSGALSWSDFKDIAPQCLEPLVAAGELGLLHRDIKPGNIMLTMTPAERFLAKILDFGLAKFSSQPSLQTLDQKGSFLGSIDYIAPEQLELRPLDQRTDLYSLGCVLYYSLTQKAPFSGDSPAQTSMNHLSHRCKHISELRSDVPRPVADWIMKMISRRVEDRPKDAADALEQLQEALEGKRKSDDYSKREPEIVSVSPVDAAHPDASADVLPPEDPDAIPVAKLAEDPSTKAKTDSARKIIVPGKSVASAKNVGKGKPRPGVAVPPPRPSLKRVSAQQSSQKSMGIVIAVGVILLLFVIGLVMWRGRDGGGGEIKTPAKVLKNGKAVSEARTSTSKAKETSSGRRPALPKKLMWDDPYPFPPELPVTDGLVTWYTGGKYAFSSGYESLAEPGDQIAAWGDLVSRSVQRSLLRDDQDSVGNRLPSLQTFDAKMMPGLLDEFRGAVLSADSSMQASKNGAGLVEGLTIFAVVKLEPGAEKFVRFSPAEKGGKMLSLSLVPSGQLAGVMKSGNKNFRVARKWDSNLPGVVSYRWNSKQQIQLLQGIQAGGHRIDPGTGKVTIPKLWISRVGIGNRGDPAEGDASHVMFELIVYSRALTDRELATMESHLARRYIAAGNQGRK